MLSSEQIIEEMSAQQLREDRASTEISIDKEEWGTSEFPPTRVKMNFFVLLHNSIYLASHISCLQYVSTM